MSNQENSSDDLRCAELEGAIVAVADGSADAEEAASVKAHVARCEACAKELGEIRELLGTVRASDVEAPVKTAGEWEAMAVATVAAARAEAEKNNGRRETGDRRPDNLRRGRGGSERPMGRLAVWTTLAAAAVIALFFGARAFMKGSGQTEQVIAHEEVVVPEVDDAIDDELVPELDELDEEELADTEAALEDEVEIDFEDLETPDVPVDEALAELSPDQLQMVLDELEQEKL